MTNLGHQASADLNGARIVLVSVSYWPEDVGIAPYSTAMAEHFVSCGADVTAIVGMPHYPSWRVRSEDRRCIRRRERRNGVDIRRFRVFVPHEQDALRRAIYEATFLLNAGMPGRLGGVDATIGVIPSLAGGVVAANIARRHNCPLGLIAQDLTGPATTQSGMRGGARAARLANWLEAGVLRRAQSVAVVSDGFRTYVEKSGVPNGRIITLRNWTRMPPPSGDCAQLRHELGWSPDKTVVLHAGNMGLKQGLEHVIAAARLAQETHPHIHFAFMGDGSQRSSLRQASSGMENVSFHEPRYGQDYSDALSVADVLLVNERNSVLDMSLPSKLTSYFLAGRPVLAAVAEGGTTEQEVKQSGAGITVAAEAPVELLHGVEELHSARLTRDFGEAGRRYAATTLGEDEALCRASSWCSALLRTSAIRLLLRAGDDAPVATADDASALRRPLGQ